LIAAADAKARPAGATREQTVKPRGTRVLIIDDDPLIRTLLVSALRKECFVAVAADGAEGFAKALELKPDVAVIDVNMPGWDGLRTLAAFREDATLRNIKIIMLTADASKQTVMAAVRAGANEYLIKTSFSKGEFYRKLNHLVPGTICESPHLNEPRRAPNAADGSAGTESLATSSNGKPSPAPGADAGQSGLAETAASSAHDAAADSQLQVMIDAWE